MYAGTKTMGIVCKGSCNFFNKSTKFAKGVKRCGHCNYSIASKGIWCKCCGGRMTGRKKTRKKQLL